MRLVTPYAPTTFLRPCLIVSTAYAEGGMKETAIRFREALNQDHALAFASDEVQKVEGILKRPIQTDWIVVEQHSSRQAAVDYHLALTETFINGGTDEEWERGTEKYLELYHKYCPDNLKSPWDKLKEESDE